MNAALLSRVAKLFKSAQNKIVIISAFIGAATLEQLLSAAPSNVKTEIFTRWRLADLAGGATDPEVFDVASKFNAKLMAHSQLHAKIYLADNQALIGSANATASGLGTSNAPNLEILTETAADNIDIANLITKLRQTSHLAKSVSLTELKSIQNLPGLSSLTRGSTTIDWLPVSKFEDVKAHIEEGHVDSDALCDCVALELSSGVSMSEIKSRVNNQKIFRLLSNAVLESVVGLSADEVIKFISDKFSISQDSAERTYPLLITWVNPCADSIYLVETPTGEPMLCPWKKF